MVTSESMIIDRGGTNGLKGEMKSKGGNRGYRLKKTCISEENSEDHLPKKIIRQYKFRVSMRLTGEFPLIIICSILGRTLEAVSKLPTPRSLTIHRFYTSDPANIFAQIVRFAAVIVVRGKKLFQTSLQSYYLYYIYT